MRSFALLLDLQIKRTFREPPAAFFTLAFAPLFTLIMGLIFGNTPRPEFGGHGYLDANLASFAAIVVAISSFVLVPVDIITQRERGALRRFRATPLRPLTYLAADILVRFVAIVASTVLALLVGILGFGAHPTGGLSLMVAAIALGVLAFLALGYALTTVVPTSAALDPRSSTPGTATPWRARGHPLHRNAHRDPLVPLGVTTARRDQRRHAPSHTTGQALIDPTTGERHTTNGA
ncbi:MAG: ABC transporter permease [Deinococcales bacterium]